MQLSERMADHVVLIDGGLSTALEEQGHHLNDPRWTARLLSEDPEALRVAHESFVAAGAEVVTSASYQTVDPDELRASVAAARSATGGSALVAASVGPYGALLHDGSEYRGRYGLSIEELVAFHAPRLATLIDAAPDAIAVETIPDIDEARALAIALADVGDELPDTWVAFSAGANPTIGRAGVATAAGDDLGDAAAVFADLDRVVALGVNCTAPSHVAPALERIAERTDRPLVAYPNGGGRWDPATGCWDQAGERITADMVASWLASGVRLLGGCCGFGPDALADLADLAGVQRRTR